MIEANKNRFIYARLAKGLSKLALAQACGVSHTIIVRIEQGAGTSPKTAKKISDVLERPVDELFTYIGETRNND